MNDNNSASGFWFSYIDSLTVIASIFLILFITVFSEIIIKDEIKVRYINARENAFSKLGNLLGEGTLEESINDGGWRITIADDILFSPNSAEVKTKGIKLIKKIAVILKNDFFINNEMIKSTRLIIGGHADTTRHQTWNDVILEEKNLFLSTRRANSVAKLLRQDLPNIIIEAIGYGHHKPKPGAKSNRENRRISIVLQPIAAEYFKSDTTITPKKFDYMSDSKYKKITRTY